jgi:hypothetical protein
VATLCQQKGYNKINCGRIVSYPQGYRGRVAIIKRGTKREQNPLAYNCVRNKARGWDKLSHPIWWGVGRSVEGGRKNYTHIHMHLEKFFQNFKLFFF